RTISRCACASAESPRLVSCWECSWTPAQPTRRLGPAGTARDRLGELEASPRERRARQCDDDRRGFGADAGPSVSAGPLLRKFTEQQRKPPGRSNRPSTRFGFVKTAVRRRASVVRAQSTGSNSLSFQVWSNH